MTATHAGATAREPRCAPPLPRFARKAGMWQRRPDRWASAMALELPAWGEARAAVQAAPHAEVGRAGTGVGAEHVDERGQAGADDAAAAQQPRVGRAQPTQRALVAPGLGRGRARVVQDAR